jgi:disulfide bond formation protein DsbB
LAEAETNFPNAFTAFWIDTFAAERYAKRRTDGIPMIAPALTLARTQPAAAAAGAIAVLGVLTMAGFFYFQYVLGYPPCPLCLEQRYAFYISVPLAAMILLGLSVGSSRKVLMLALFAIAAAMLWNAGLGVYHSGVEWHWWPGPQDCSGATPNFSAGGSLIDQINRTRVIRCDEAAWRLFGLSLAGYNVLVSLSIAAIAIWGALQTWRSAPEKFG